MKPTVKYLTSKKFVGLSMAMSLSDNKMGALWPKLKPRHTTIKNRIGTQWYDLQIYDPQLEFKHFNPTTIFTNWALAEVSTFENQEMWFEQFQLPGGSYAVFIHQGPAHTISKTMHYIFTQWLPNSNYQLDQRPHFQVMEDNYQLHDPQAQEEVWIPIRDKVKSS